MNKKYYSANLENEIIVVCYSTSDTTQNEEEVGCVAFAIFDEEIITPITTHIITNKVIIRN